MPLKDIHAWLRHIGESWRLTYSRCGHTVDLLYPAEKGWTRAKQAAFIRRQYGVCLECSVPRRLPLGMAQLAVLPDSARQPLAA